MDIQVWDDGFRTPGRWDCIFVSEFPKVFTGNVASLIRNLMLAGF